jgi:hypothetical protein
MACYTDKGFIGDPGDLPQKPIGANPSLLTRRVLFIECEPLRVAILSRIASSVKLVRISSKGAETIPVTASFFD